MKITNNNSPLLGISVLNIGEVKRCTKTTKRIWIANSNITKSFSIGDTVFVNYDREKREITIEKVDGLGNHTISSRASKEPIIDIKNRLVEETLGDIEKVEVRFYKNKAVIKVSSNDKARIDRVNKNILNTFELFSGAGTLSHFFKKAGFRVDGALEMCDKYLSLYKRNHGEHVFSINAKIEDIDQDDYPKNISVALVGIPCDTYSGGNISMQKAIKDKSEGKNYEQKYIAERHKAEALTFYVLNAIKAMNPKTVIVEEVEEYSRTSASIMLRTVLSQFGYKLSETVSEGNHTKRKRWCLVASSIDTVNLENLVGDDNKTITTLLEKPLEQREWKTAQENKRVSGMLRKGLGVRSCLPSDMKCNAFTTNGTRHTEPILKHPSKNLYSEFTEAEIRNIHGLDGFILSGVKTFDREVLGQGVTDMFAEVANRVKMQLIAEHQTVGVCNV